MLPRTVAGLLCPILVLLSGAAAAAELSLEQALELAREHNRALSSVRFQVSEQEAALRSARSERWPTLDFSQRLTRIDPDTVSRANAAATGLSQLIGFEIPPFVFEDSFRTQLELAVPVWTSGGLRAAVAAEDDGLDARRAENQATWRSVQGEVARRFFTAVSSRQVMAARRQALERAERRLLEAERRLEVGLTTRQEVLRWQVEVESSRAAVAGAEADLFVADLELGDVLGRPAMDLGEPEAPPPEVVDALLEWADGLEPLEVMRRADAGLDELPEVRAARSRADASGEAVRQTRAARRPRLDAAASYGWLENQTFELDEFANWSASLLLTVPIDLRGRLSAEIARGQARREDAEVAVDDVRAARRLELGRAVAEVVRVRSRLRSARRAEQEAASRRELLVRQTEVGVTSLLDLIDADTTLANAEVARAAARVDLLAAVAALELVWPEADPPDGGVIP